MIFIKEIKLVFDENTLAKYNDYYFKIHPRAVNKPLAHPYHESINTWMTMKRPMMNSLKQKWKSFIIWLVDNQGYTNLRIEKCEISQSVYYPNNRRHDIDNSTPKFILDGLVESGMIVDDDSKHIQCLTMRCFTDIDRPRTELTIKILNDNYNFLRSKRYGK